MSQIKIAVACHKPSTLPKNKFFIPVQVGTSIASKKLENMCHDNEGENISDKNPNYCELTAQYWLWKNEKADYYGLCHYRRFLAFRDPGAKRNLRNQIDATITDQYNFDRFGLEDEDLMEKEIKSADLIIGDVQKVSQLYTPRGVQRTAYQHWAKHDGALIMKEDLDKMLNILEQVSPKIGKYARKYLNGKEFLGFNCFIAKKELFDELCNIEFETLFRLEKEIDLKNYNQQLTRIYGFMAEIISSAYFSYIEKTRAYKVIHKPLVYFEYTEPLDICDKKNAITIIFNQADNDPILFAPIWQSFLEHTNSKSRYNTFLVAETTKDLEQSFIKMNKKDNVSLTYINAKMLRDIINERCSKKMQLDIEKTKPKHQFEKRQTIPVLPAIPLLFENIDRAIIFDENIIITDDIDELWRNSDKMNQIIAAAKNANIISKVNDVYPETLKISLKKMIKNPYDYFGISAFVLNLEKFRKQYSFIDLKSTYLKTKKIFSKYDKEIIMNALCEGNVKWLDQKWNVWYGSNVNLRKQLPYLPLPMFKELEKSQKCPTIICFEDDDPFGFEYNTICSQYWEYARKTPVYENLQTFQIKFAIKNQSVRRPIVAKLFPIDSRARGKMTKILPPGSRRNKKAKELLNKLGLR